MSAAAGSLILGPSTIGSYDAQQEASCATREVRNSYARCSSTKISSRNSLFNYNLRIEVVRTRNGKLSDSRRNPNQSTRCGMKNAQVLIGNGIIKAVPANKAGPFLAEGGQGWRLLDVRPQWEREKAYVAGSLHVPLFVEDTASDPLTLLKKQIQFGFGGWWLGQRLTKQNEKFAAEVAEIAGHKDSRLLVACGEGLRSLMALDELHEAGFRQLAWLAGGFNNARDGDFEDVQGETRLQYATAGGVQGLILKLGQAVAQTTASGKEDAPKS